LRRGIAPQVLNFTEIKTTMKYKKVFFIVTALAAVLLAVGAFYDLQITYALYEEGSAWAYVLKVVAEFPSLIVTCGMCAYLFFYSRAIGGKNRNARMALCVVGGTGGLVYVMTTLLRYLGVESGGAPYYIIVFAGIAGLAAILSAAAFMVRRRVLASSLDEAEAAHCMLSCIIAALATLVVINAVKIFWGRWRFGEMLSAGDTALSSFTPWYQPNGMNGHRSFPSGHSANTIILLFGTYFFRLMHKKIFTKVLLVVLPVAFLVAVGVSRIVYGDHYFSDIVAGTYLGALIVYVVGVVRREI
jgi:membrane-associated phospholipid phosphatase